MGEADFTGLSKALRTLGDGAAERLAKRADLDLRTVHRAAARGPIHRATARALVAACSEVLAEASNVAA